MSKSVTTASHLFRAALSVSAVLLAGTQAAHATDGYFLNGAGKAKGAGGAGIALPLDAMSLAANPAAATELGERLNLGAEVFVPSRGAVIHGNGAGLNGTWSGNGANPFVLPELGYVRPLSSRVAIGITISGNGGMNTHYSQNPFASFGATGSAGVDLKQVFVAPTVAVRLAEGHSIGVSPLLLIQAFEMNGIQPFTAASADPTHMSNQGTSWSTGYGVRVGYLGKLNDAISIGAFYQSKVAASPFRKYAGLFADHGDFDVPASWGGGVAIKATPALTFAADFKRIEYSGVGSVGNPLARLFSNVPFGAANGPGFGWHDINAVKAGVHYKLNNKLTLRAGYGHSDNPVPASETFLNILAPGVVTHHITAGATVALNQGLELSLYAMHAPRQTVKGSGSIPSSYGSGEADVHLSETATGFSLGFIF